MNKMMADWSAITNEATATVEIKLIDLSTSSSLDTSLSSVVGLMKGLAPSYDEEKENHYLDSLGTAI